MQSRRVLPTWRELPSDNLGGPNDAYATITDHGTHRRVLFPGTIATNGDITEQVRTTLSYRREALQNVGGSMNDVVRTRYLVRKNRFDRGTQGTIHEARDGFFEHPHYPASTMVGVGSLLAEDALVEIEVEAEIPNGEWDVEVLVEDDV